MSDRKIDRANDRRLFARIQVESTVELFTGDQTVEATLKDISLKGALIQLKNTDQWQAVIGNHCEIVITLTTSMQKIYMHTKIAHVSNNSMIGLLCEHIDSESINHVRNLLQQKLGNDALIQRELKTLWLTVEGI